MLPVLIKHLTSCDPTWAFRLWIWLDFRQDFSCGWLLFSVCINFASAAGESHCHPKSCLRSRDSRDMELGRAGTDFIPNIPTTFFRYVWLIYDSRGTIPPVSNAMAASNSNRQQAASARFGGGWCGRWVTVAYSFPGNNIWNIRRSDSDAIQHPQKHCATKRPVIQC